MDRPTEEDIRPASESSRNAAGRWLIDVVRRFCERRVIETGRRRPCVSCGDPIVTEPTEASLECPECTRRTDDVE